MTSQKNKTKLLPTAHTLRRRVWKPENEHYALARIIAFFYAQIMVGVRRRRKPAGFNSDVPSGLPICVPPSPLFGSTGDGFLNKIGTTS